MPVPMITNTADPTQNTDAQNRKTQQQGTGFTNINQILDANQGAGQKEGQQIGNQLNNQASNVRAGIQASQQQFNTQKDQGSQAANSAIQAGQNLTQQAGESNDAYANRLAGGTTDYTQLGQNLQNAAYTGPMGLNNAEQLQAQASTAAQLGQLGGTSQGQTQLLQSFVAQPGNYTTGQAALDSLLLGQGGQNAIQQGRHATVGLNGQTTGAINQATNQAQALQTGIQNNRANAIQAIQNSLTGAGDQTSNNITGLQTLAQQQAQSFDTNAQRIQQLISGTATNSDGSLVNQNNMSDSDKALLQNLSQYGLNGQQAFYTGDQSADQIALNSLAGTLALPNGGTGGYDYTGNQSQAAQNLANVLGQTDIANSIKNNQFNTNVYSQDPNVINAQNVAKQNALNQLSGTQEQLSAYQNVLGAGQGGASNGLGFANGLSGFAAQQQSQMNAGVDNGQLQNQAKTYLNGPQGSALLDNLTPDQRTSIDQATGGWNKDAVKWVQLANQAMQQNYQASSSQLAQQQGAYNTGNSDLYNAILQRLSQNGS